MKTLFCSLILAAAILVIGGLGFVHSGLYSVAATEPHWPVSHWSLTNGARSLTRALIPAALSALREHVVSIVLGNYRQCFDASCGR